MVGTEHSLLSEQIELLDKVLAASTDYLYVFDRAGRYLYASPAGLAVLGLQASDLLGKNWRELNIPVEVIEHHDTQQESVFQTGIPVTGETRYPSVNGIRYYEYVISPIRGTDGAIEAVINTGRDITERKQTEDASQQLTEELEAKVAARTQELATLNQSLRLEIAERQKAEQALKESEMRFQVLVEAMFEGFVVQGNGKIIDANPGFASIFGYSLEEVMGKTAADFLPSKSLETVLHHIENQHELPYEITGVKKDGTLIALEVVGKQSLYQGQSVRVSAVRDITERKQAELALQEKQMQIQRQLAEIETIYQSAPIGLNVLDTELRFVRINQRLAEMNGFSVEAHIGRTVRELLPDLADTAERLLRPILETGQPLLNVEIQGETPAQPGIQRTWVESFLPLRDGDRIIGISTVCQEITERKRIEAERNQAEQTLAKELLRIQTLFRTSFDGIVILDEAGAVLDANPRFSEMLGYSLEETANLDIFNWDAQFNREELQQIMQDYAIHKSGVLETQHRRKDGSIYDVEISSNVVEWEGEILRFCVCRDITERKQAEQTLQEREAILRLFAQFAPAGIAMFDRDMRYLMASQRWVDDYNLDSIESLIGRSHYEVFPDVPERWKQVHQRSLAGAIETCDEDLFVRTNGSQHWIRWEVRPWYRATNEIGGIIVFSEDITQRKQAEASVLQLNRELQQKVAELQTLLDVIPIGIGIADDPDCHHIRVNPAFAQTLDIPPTLNASLSAPEEERPNSFKVYQNGREMLTEELPLQYAARHNVEVRDLEVDVIWQDGTVVTLLEYAAPLLDEQGQIRGSVGAFLNITERKQAEAALRESQERYRALVQNFPNGVVCLFDHNLRYVLAEGQGLTEVGIARTSLEGKTIWEALGSEACRLIEPYYRETLAGISQVVELPFADRIYQAYFLPIHDDRGLIKLGMVMTQDITFQKQAEQALKTSRDELERQVQARTRELREANELLQQREREFRTLVENTPDMITRHDRQYRYLYVNPAGIQQSDIPVAVSLGKKPSEIGQLREINNFWEASLETVFVTGTMQIDEFQVLHQEELKAYQTYIVPEFGAEGNVESVLTISRDITELRKAEEASRQLAEELKRSNRELEQFAYVASHDLQESLRAVTSFTQMLAKRYQNQLDAKANTYIEFIVDGATRMQQLIKDLLAYSRAGRYELKLQPVNCNELLQQVKRDLQIAIAEAHAVITADPLPTVTADPNQLRNLLQNLIGNAIKYRSEIPLQIHVASRKNTSESLPGIFSELDHEEWIFSIQDNGIGIDPQYAERIFGIFQRLHTSDEYPGTGLGLAICRKIVERHQGRIWVESCLGQGATFCFALPTSIRSQDDSPGEITHNSAD